LEEFEGFFGGHGRDRTRIYAPARIRNRFARGKAKRMHRFGCILFVLFPTVCQGNI
jgi:hypothetical protein